MKIRPTHNFAKITILLPIVWMLALTGCEGPSDRRKVKTGSATSTTNSNSSYSFTDSGSNTSTNNNNNNNNSSSNNNNSTTDTTNLGSEFSHCSMNSYPQNHGLLGSFNICKSNLPSAKKIVFRPQNSIADYRLCLFPTNDDTGSGSVMIGSARCFYAVAGRIETVEFSVNRQGFMDKRVSGVIIVKDMPYGEVTPYHTNSSTVTYTTAYEDCMTYLYNTGDSLACQRFKNKGNYVYVTL